MARIPYQPQDLSEPANIVTAIRKRRGGTLNPVDRMLLHAPPIARGWNDLMLAMRTELALPALYRELAVCCIGRIHSNDFEFNVHAPIFLNEGGRKDQLDALNDLEEAARNTERFTPTERAIIRFTYESSKYVEVCDRTFEELRNNLPDTRQIVELTAIVASYNMAARFIAALNVELEIVE